MRNRRFDTPYECPNCGLLVQGEYECPGYSEHNGTVMVCSPPCGSAVELTCPICDWWFRHPNNRGDRSKMGVRPEWIEQAIKEYLSSPEEFDDEEEPYLAWAQEYISLGVEDDELPHSCGLDCEYCGP